MKNTKEAVVDFACRLDSYHLIELRRFITDGPSESEVLQSKELTEEIIKKISLLEASILTFSEIITLFLDSEEKSLYYKSLEEKNEYQKVEILRDIIFTLRSDAYSKEEGGKIKSRIEKTKSRRNTAVGTLVGTGVGSFLFDYWLEGQGMKVLDFLLTNGKQIKNFGLSVVLPAGIVGWSQWWISKLTEKFHETRRPYKDGDTRADTLRLIRRVFDQDLIKNDMPAFIALVNMYVELSEKYPKIVGRKINLKHPSFDNTMD